MTLEISNCEQDWTRSFEMKMNLLLLSLFAKYKDMLEKDLFIPFEEHAYKIIQLSVDITEVLVSDLQNATVHDKSEKIAQIIYYSSRNTSY